MPTKIAFASISISWLRPRAGDGAGRGTRGGDRRTLALAPDAVAVAGAAPKESTREAEFTCAGVGKADWVGATAYIQKNADREQGKAEVVKVKRMERRAKGTGAGGRKEQAYMHRHARERIGRSQYC